MTGIIYQLAPKNIVHSWVEIFFDENGNSPDDFFVQHN